MWGRSEGIESEFSALSLSLNKEGPLRRFYDGKTVPAGEHQGHRIEALETMLYEVISETFRKLVV